jgi:outer membrane receptor for monomeric catechols
MRDPGNASRETFAVEQVEIYKGPSGTIGGRGVTGGAINLISKKPNEAYNFGDVSSMFGTDKTVRTTTNLLSKYQLSDRLSVAGQAIYSSEVFGGLFGVANEGNRIPAHWRFDLLCEYKFSHNFSTQLNVINITNELYYDAVYRDATPFAFVAPGRAGYLTLSWKY